MDDNLMGNSNADILQKLFVEIKIFLACWGSKMSPEELQSGDYIINQGHKIGLQKTQPQKVQIRRDQLQTLNDFSKISMRYLLATVNIWINYLRVN